MDEEQARLHAIISGRVQGVSFRDYTTRKANELDVVGWVMNRRDGRVEVTAEGSRDALTALLDFLHEGPPAARVESVEEQWFAARDEFSKFEIRFDT